MAKSATKPKEKKRERYPRKVYERELLRLQGELVKMSYWVRNEGARVLVLFEGRDASGKGGVIKRITEFLSPRIARVAALPAPNARRPSGTFSATRPTCRPPGRSCCSTAAGTTGPGSRP